VIFFSFIFARTSRRYDPTHATSKCADNDQFQTVKKTAHHVPRFTTSIGSKSDRGAIEDEAQLFKVDAAFAQDAITLLIVPPELTNLREQPLKIFRHSEAPHELGCDTFVSFRGFAMTISKR
jgi:hypothetical protein